MVSLQKQTNASGLIATILSQGHVEVKAAESRIIFLDDGARSTVDHSKMLYGCEKTVLKTFDLQDSETSGQMENS